MVATIRAIAATIRGAAATVRVVGARGTRIRPRDLPPRWLGCGRQCPEPAGLAHTVKPARVTRRPVLTVLVVLTVLAVLAVLTMLTVITGVTDRAEPAGVTEGVVATRVAHHAEPVGVANRAELPGVTDGVEPVGSAGAAEPARVGDAAKATRIALVDWRVELVARNLVKGLRAGESPGSGRVGTRARLPRGPRIASLRSLGMRKTGTLSVPCAIAAPTPAHQFLPVQSLGAGPGIQPR